LYSHVVMKIRNIVHGALGIDIELMHHNGDQVVAIISAVTPAKGMFSGGSFNWTIVYGRLTRLCTSTNRCQ
jgi:hypothetical protein